MIDRLLDAFYEAVTPIIGFRQYIFANGERIATVSNVESSANANADGDNLANHLDNCGLLHNNDQKDTDGDDFGNACDPDLNNDGLVNFADFAIFGPSLPSALGGPNYNEHADFDGSDTINFLDYNILTSFYLIGPGPSHRTSIGESVQYFHTDHLSSIDTVTDSSGGVIAEYSYDAFGQRRDPETWKFDIDDIPTGLDWEATTRGYTDHEQLRGVALIHMNGRVYDPLVGRAISADPFIPYPTLTQSYNRYSYVRNNPTSMYDPTGYNCEVTAFCRNQFYETFGDEYSAAASSIYFQGDSINSENLPATEEASDANLPSAPSDLSRTSQRVRISVSNRSGTLSGARYLYDFETREISHFDGLGSRTVLTGSAVSGGKPKSLGPLPNGVYRIGKNDPTNESYFSGGFCAPGQADKCDFIRLHHMQYDDTLKELHRFSLGIHNDGDVLNQTNGCIGINSCPIIDIFRHIENNSELLFEVINSPGTPFRPPRTK